MERSLLDHPALARHFTPEHRELRSRARSYFDPARLPDWVGPGGYLTKAQWEELGRQELLGVSLPRELGGQGLGLLGALILSEAASGLGDLGVSLGMHCQTEITAHWLATAHAPEVRDRYLPGMIAGRLVGCACDTEPGPQEGQRERQVESTAVRDGDELVVHARKLYVVNGANADLCFVTLKAAGEMATVLVEKERPGVHVLEVFDKLGTRSIDQARLEFDGVRVPAANLSTKRGVRQLMHWNKVMTAPRFLMCADACFLHRRLLDRMLEYGGRRIVEGRPLAAWPINRQALARAAADQELMQAGLLDAFEQLESQRNAVAEIAALKWFCVDRTARFAALCAELHGGAGYMWTSEFLFAQAQILGLKMAGGSLITMKSIAGQALAYREELEALA
ncbi:MAG TPA: acyl-CoA dehydrogenase family protein [Thermoanaerobaculia bacterium]|nr:acyl-CoA dehydrogenase family protein [Thermoanaerobaculia bacterium]